MQPPRVDNHTDFVLEPQLLVDRDGEKLCAMVKGTFELVGWTSGVDGTGALVVAPPGRRRGLRPADVPWGEPERSSVLYPGDYALRKPGTDVVVVAKGHAPGGRPAPHFDVGVRVGALGKSLRVHGLRVWERGGSGISTARPVTEVELRYELAWGGSDATEPEALVEEPRNPVGRGVVRDASRLTHQPAPQLEDPAEPIDSAGGRHTPAGLAAIGRHWEPRRRLWGSYDARWLTDRAPLLPDDFDERANQCASPGLVAQPALRGDEPVALHNLLPGGGAQTFRLPGLGVELCFEVGGRAPETVRPHLDTVLLDALAVPRAPLTIELVWRASVRAPRRLKDARITLSSRPLRDEGKGRA
jgi:hypothetical protein